MKSYAKPIYTLNMYKGSACSSKDSSEYVMESYQVGVCNMYNDGVFEAFLYHNGEQEDYEINGWTFASFCKGYFHVPGRYEDFSMDIEGIDQLGNRFKINRGIPNTCNYNVEAIGAYMNAIMETCVFKSAIDAEKVYKVEENLINNLQEKAEGIRIFKKNIDIAEKEAIVPDKYIQNAKRRYNKLLEDFKEKVSKEDLLNIVFPDL